MSEHPETPKGALGYQFRDTGLLLQALTHRSRGTPNNERLEFLGDALLNFVIGEAVFSARPGAAEGDLSRLRSAIVREDTLAIVARRIGLGEVLRLGPGELKSGGFRRDSTLADALEAVLGAVLCDGGFDAAREACLQLFAPELAALPQSVAPKDAKTRLQEHLQGSGRPLPDYSLVEESGPPHRRRFRVRCRLKDGDLETWGEDLGRKPAEQSAAGAMLVLLGAAGAVPATPATTDNNASASAGPTMGDAAGAGERNA